MKTIIMTFIVLVILSVTSYSQEEKSVSETEKRVVKAEPGKSIEDTTGKDETEKVVTPSYPKKKMFGPGVTKIGSEKAIDSLGVPMWRVAAAMAIIVVALGGVMFLLKKYGYKVSGKEKVPSMNVISRVNLDGKNSLVMVRVFEEDVLIGIGTNGVNLISKYSAIDSIDEESDDDVDETDRLERLIQKKLGGDEIEVDNIEEDRYDNTNIKIEA